MVYFSRETCYLLNFFNSIEKIYVKKNKNSINTSINKFLNLIYMKLKKIKEKIYPDIDGKIIKYSNIFFEKNQMFNYIPENIKKHIKLYSKNIIYYFFNNNNNESLINKQIKIYFIIEESEKKILIQEYNKYVKRILSWFYLIKDNINTECCKTLNIYIFMSSLKKTIPNNLDILDHKNVNTGLTTSCPKNGEIIIFRKEEWFKVFIHETFHSFGIDFSLNLKNDNNYYEKELTRNIFKVNSIVRLYEAYTEFWAEIFNIIFFSYDIVKYDKDKDKENNFIKVFHYLLNNEIKFSIFQMIKILKHMDLTYDELIKTSEITNNKYKEKTNVMAYYILKLILLYNYNYFIYWCIKNNNNIIYFDEKNKNKFLIFISNYYNNNEMLNDIKEMQKNVKKINNNADNYFLLKTLRLSIYD